MSARLQDRRSSALAAITLTVCCWSVGFPDGAAGGQRTVIGHSVRSRPLIATVKGDLQAADRFLVIGCIHGDEPAGVRVARRLLASAPKRGAALWVIPTLNPDGVAAGTRGNAHHVDLNRNFPFAWRALGGLEYSGPHPLSEPESRAIGRLVRRIEPDVTIWFHQPFGLVDRSGGTAAIERRYSELVGLPLVGLRRYPGSASSWQNHTLPQSTAFVVELPTLVSGALVKRAATAVTILLGEYASVGVGDAGQAR